MQSGSGRPSLRMCLSNLRRSTRRQSRWGTNNHRESESRGKRKRTVEDGLCDRAWTKTSSPSLHSFHFIPTPLFPERVRVSWTGWKEQRHRLLQASSNVWVASLASSISCKNPATAESSTVAILPFEPVSQRDRLVGWTRRERITAFPVLSPIGRRIFSARGFLWKILAGRPASRYAYPSLPQKLPDLGGRQRPVQVDEELRLRGHIGRNAGGLHSRRGREKGDSRERGCHPPPLISSIPGAGFRQVDESEERRE